MFQKLDDVEKRYEELNKLISDPEMISKQDEWRKLMKEHSSIEDVVMKYREYKKVANDLEEAKEMLNDPDLKELAEADMHEAKEKLPKIEEELKILLIPKDPNDDNNVICEIRAGAGGEEAALFAGTLFRMYSMYAERKHWKLEVLNENASIVSYTYYGSEKAIEGYNVMGVAKAALESSMRFIAMDLGKFNIRCNCLSAGPVKTLAAKGIGGFDKMLKFNALKAPLNRTPSLEDVGKAGLYLASDLSSGVTGQVQFVDCGASSVFASIDEMECLNHNA